MVLKQTRVINIRKLSDSILETELRPTFEGDETLKDAEENIATFKEIMKDHKMCLLSKLPSHYIQTEAINYYKQVGPVFHAIALWGGSFSQIMVGNIFLKIVPNHTPTKIFKTREAAVEWLDQINTKNNKQNN